LKIKRILKFNIFYYILFLSFTCVSAAGYEKNGNIEETKRTIIDCAGRRVEIPGKIERIACLYAFSGHAVTMLGRGDDIIAVSNGLKRDSLLHRICPSILNAFVPKAQGSINIEELLRARPDILFLPADVNQNKAETDKLEKFKIPYLVVDYKNIKEQQRAVTMIGEVLNENERAASYNRYYNESMKKVRAVTSMIPDDKKLRLFHSVNEANRTNINTNLSTDWLDVMGVINVSYSKEANTTGGRNFVSLEQIHIWNPDVILVNEPKVKIHMLSERQWATLKAIKEKKVVLMPIGISRWGHPGSIETPLAILWTAKTLYPDRFNEMDMTGETKAFYMDFFNHALPDQLVNQVLSGKLVRKPKKKKY
jgi:iron complex transport system substrate-binding protein